ncbi:TolC family protein [Buttiauxella sp. B2]|uniref:TolC family protein n=1 Tax=Buttiauxella sp. B2 TaxID=2587812 RepID=UPI00167878C7|nr:TolC family protein [Buttiauxella sp. B2]
MNRSKEVKSFLMLCFISYNSMFISSAFASIKNSDYKSDFYDNDAWQNNRDNKFITAGDSVAANHSIRSQSVKSYLARIALAAKNYTPQLREALSTYDAANADVKQAEGQRYPQVDIGVQSSPVQFGSGARVDKQNMTNGLSVNMKTPVFDWGYNSKTIKSKSYTAEAANANYQAQYEDSSYQVCSLLSELAKQKSIYNLSQSFVIRMQKLVAMIGDISKVDSGRVSELTQAQARLLQAEASRDSAESKMRDAEISLQKLTGISSYDDLPSSALWDLHLDHPDDLLKDVMHHPSVVQAENQALAELESAKAVKASDLPKLEWVVTKTVPINKGAYEEAWQTYLNVSWGIFRGGSANAAEEAAALRAQAAAEKISEQSISLTSKVRSGIHNVKSMLDQSRQYHQLVIETDKVRKDFFEQWRQLNTRSLLDVLTAESDHYNNQVNEVSTRFSAYTNIFSSYSNAGKLNAWLGIN